ncbi:hypothetical protein [Streptomyces sp. NPDC058728]|uniref:hypothetical protein n=1 Tax=Streptomyces sp. NPDC058728 TaxID=3346612 RepID=UPI00368A14EB
MLTPTANGDSRLSHWLRVREFAVPPSMIETATARRRAGDWAGACAAARIDVDLDLRRLARHHGHDLEALIRADLRHLAPDLLRWHMPRIAPDGLLRPGLTLSLARYDVPGRGGERPLHLVVRTPPAWADGGQRISLALWDGTRPETGPGGHPHPRPNRRYRLDLHRHLWDARMTDVLRIRAGAGAGGPDSVRIPPYPDPPVTPPGRHCAVDRWAAEAGLLLRAEGRRTGTGTVTVRLGAGHLLVLDLDLDPDPVRHPGPGPGPAPVPDVPRPPALRIAAAPADGSASALPVLPDAATWVLPDLELLRAGAIDPDRLHPLVASALAPDRAPAAAARRTEGAEEPRTVECRGARHRIGLVDGALAALDHDPAEIRREELLVALTGTPLPCLRAIDEAHRRPDCLTGVRERLHHGDTAGALAVVEGLLGPAAVLRTGALRDALAAAAERRITYGLFRAGLAGPGPRAIGPVPARPRGLGSRPRGTTSR